MVEGAFTGGGNNLGAVSDHRDRFEVQNYTSVQRASHFWNLGARLRTDRDANRSTGNYNGQYLFATLAAYQLTVQGIQHGLTAAQIRTNGGGASQFSITQGNPNAAVTLADLGMFLQDDWKLRPNLTLSGGLRFETQNGIADHADWAPRAGFSWAIGAAKKPAKYVLRGGAGFFYTRFTTVSALQVQRQNGVTQQAYVANAPDTYPVIPAVASLGAQAAPTIYRISPAFHAPAFLGATVGLDRQLGKRGTLGLTYLYNRGTHQQLTENVNAPLPGTYNPAIPASGVRPFGGNQNIYEFVSAGIYRSNRLSANLSLRLGKRLSMFGYYMLRFDHNDAQGGGFPSNQYDLGVDYGRSLADTRHTLTLGANSDLGFGFHANTYIRAVSGAPFNIVVGQDLNGDTQYNDRPSFATDLTRTSVIATRFGTFDTSPIAGQTIIPRNYGQGPGFFLVNLSLGKSIGVGPKQKPPAARAAAAKASPKPLPIARRYTLDFTLDLENLLNHPNYGPPVGTLGSPLFGRSVSLINVNGLTSDRLIDFQMTAHF